MRALVREGVASIILVGLLGVQSTALGDITASKADVKEGEGEAKQKEEREQTRNIWFYGILTF